MRIALVLFALLVSGCAVVVPVHESEPPEVLDNWGFRLGYFQGSSPAVAPLDTGVTTGDGNQAFPLGGLRLSAGFLERWQFNLDTFVGFISGGSSLALKYQWTGDTYFKAKKGNKVQTSAVRIFSGSAGGLTLSYNGQDIFDETTVNGRGYDVSHIWGWRFADAGGLYGGPKFTTGRVEAEYRTEADGPIVATSTRDFYGIGGLGGIHWSPHGEHIGFDLVFEIQVMNMPDMYVDKRSTNVTYVLGLNLPFSFN